MRSPALGVALLAATALSPAFAQTAADGKSLTGAEIALGLLSGTIKQTQTFDAAGGGGQSTVIGSGPDELTLQVSQQRYHGDATAAVLVDGQPAGTFAVSALQGQGVDTVTLRGNWGAGKHDVQVVFQDDFDRDADWSDPDRVIAAGGHDRNVIVESVSYNGQQVSDGPLVLYNERSRNTVTFTGAAGTISGTGTLTTPSGVVIETGPTAIAGTGATDQGGGAPQANLGASHAVGGGMTDEQLAAVQKYLAGNTGATLTPQQVAQVTASNPLLAAAAAQGQDTSAAAAQVAAGTAAFSLPGFSVVWMESFTDGNCTGMLANVWGPGVKCPSPGLITLHSTRDNRDSGAETKPPGYGTPGAGGGWGYGLYSFTLRWTGARKPGPYALLWPGTNVWPGPELDVVEVREDGTAYATVHWKAAGNKNGFRSVDYTGVDPMQVHTYSILWLPGQIRFFCDGKQYGPAVTENVPADGAHGGEWLAPGVGMQTSWNSGGQHGAAMEVYNVSYATTDVAQAVR